MNLEINKIKNIKLINLKESYIIFKKKKKIGLNIRVKLKIKLMNYQSWFKNHEMKNKLLWKIIILKKLLIKKIK